MKPTASAPIDVKISARGGPIRWLVIGGFLLIAAITLGTTIMAGNFRERALTSAESQLENNVLLMARHFDQQLEDFMGIQRDVVAQIERSGVASPEAFRAMMSTAEWHDMLKLRLRADRIDHVADGQQLLVDYKSGKVSTNDWDGMRPKEPQLPLYAAYGGEENLRGILFAQIRAGSVDFVGRVDDAITTLDASLNKNSRLLKEPYNAAMKEEWAAVLRDLADEFLRGEAAVAPKRYPATCELCRLGSLCRVRETRVPLNASIVDDEDAEKDQPKNDSEESEAAVESDD